MSCKDSCLYARVWHITMVWPLNITESFLFSKQFLPFVFISWFKQIWWDFVVYVCNIT
jgi:hypothetical protein